jgi:hypothetical protein
MDGVDGKAEHAVAMLLDVEALQPAGGDILVDEVQRDVAPAEAGEKVLEAAAAEIAEPPGPPRGVSGR